MIQATPMVDFPAKPQVQDREPSANGETESLRASLAEAEADLNLELPASRYKTRLCKNYLETGRCPYTTRCRFAHGTHELRSTDENLRDGLISDAAVKAFQRCRAREGRRVAPPSFEEAVGWEGESSALPLPPPLPMPSLPLPCGRRYRHNPYLPALLHTEDRLWSTPMEEEMMGMGVGEELYAPYADAEPYYGGGFFPGDFYADGEIVPPVQPALSVAMDEYDGDLHGTVPSRKLVGSSVSLDEYDELRNNTGMILEP